MAGILLRAKARLLVIQWPDRYRKHRSGPGPLSESGVGVALFLSIASKEVVHVTHTLAYQVGGDASALYHEQERT
jgi:hypothetical protein